MTDVGLVVRNIRARKLRAFLTITSIFAAFLILGVLASVVAPAGSNSSTNQRLVVANEVSLMQPLPLRYADEIAKVPGADHVTYSVWFGGYFEDPRNYLVALAVDPQSYAQVYPELKIAPGDEQRFVDDPGSALVGRMLAGRFGWRIGDLVPIQSNIYHPADGGNSWKIKIAGIFDGTTPAQNSMMLLHYSFLEQNRQFQQGTVTQFIVSARPEIQSKLAHAIDLHFQTSSIATQTVPEDSYSSLFLKQLGDVYKFVLTVIGVALLSMLLIVANNMMLSIRDRRREIAILKSLGFAPTRIARLCLIESLMFSAIGGLAGLALASTIVSSLASSGALTGIVMTPAVWAVAILLLGTFAMLAAVPAGLSAYRLPVPSTLHGR